MPKANQMFLKCFDLKLGPVTKLPRGKQKTSKKIDNDIISENCDNIVIF